MILHDCCELFFEEGKSSDGKNSGIDFMIM